jgi:PHD/YefM family antitoxin component YafN of YafNO toxin-antitoxin module
LDAQTQVIGGEAYSFINTTHARVIVIESKSGHTEVVITGRNGKEVNLITESNNDSSKTLVIKEKGDE